MTDELIDEVNALEASRIAKAVRRYGPEGEVLEDATSACPAPPLRSVGVEHD